MISKEALVYDILTNSVSTEDLRKAVNRTLKEVSKQRGDAFGMRKLVNAMLAEKLDYPDCDCHCFEELCSQKEQSRANAAVKLLEDILIEQVDKSLCDFWSHALNKHGLGLIKRK